MITVVKRSGKEEAFDIDKMRKSITNASDELHQPLNKSDIDVLLDDIKDNVSKKEKVTSKELFDMLLNAMKSEGFSYLANSYINSSSNLWIDYKN